MANTSINLEGKTHLDLLKLGTRDYWVRKYANAVTYLAKCSELLVEEHKDDKHESLGIVYLYYGKSLLELSRESGDPLGDGVPKEVGVEADDGSDISLDGEVYGIEENSDDEPTENGTDETAEEVKENGTTNGSKLDDTETEDVKEADDSKVEEMDCNDTAETSKIEGEEEEEAAEEEAAEEDELAAEGEAVDKSPEEEEPSDLQLAWEVLELAKVILEKKGEEFLADYADCLVTLGEVSLESENFDSAIADISSGLNIQKEIWTNSDDFRKLAETYYKLGMALAAHNQIEEGVKNYEVSLNLVKDRLKVLQEKKELGTSDKDEIKDIKNLIPDLEEKIGDLRSFKEQANNKMEEEKPAPSSPEKKVNNISHLVKRKRKLEEITDEVAASASKKAAASSTSSDKKTESSSDQKEESTSDHVAETPNAN